MVWPIGLVVLLQARFAFRLLLTFADVIDPTVNPGSAKIVVAGKHVARYRKPGLVMYGQQRCSRASMIFSACKVG